MYDESGKPQSIYYNNGSTTSKYYFIKNLQGDVVQLRDYHNNLIAKYIYDPWGKVVSITDADGNQITSASHIANINPIRYRGYYFDTETGLYYLQSRYYSPDTGRFISSDGQLNGGFLGYNLFAYCENNPIICADYFGNAASLVIATMPAWGPALLEAIEILAIAVTTCVGIGIIATNTEKLSDSDLTYDPAIDVPGPIAIPITSPLTDAIEDPESDVKADKKVKNTVKKKSRNRYWTATVRIGHVDIGRPLTYIQAVKEVYAGRSVFTVTWYEAKAVALAAGGSTGRNNKTLYPEIDKGKENTPGYYYHYHTYNHNGGHVYYLF